jgi:DamX protein
MTEFTSSQAEPSYVSRLALTSAPYNEAVDVNSFFNGKEIEQRLNLLLHLIQASNQIGFLVAPQGTGKSCLLTQLQVRADDSLRVCLIEAKSVLDTTSLLSQCLRVFGVDDSEIGLNDDATSLLKNRLLQLQKINIKPLLLIDDIDSLPAEVLKEVTSWLLWQQDETFLLQAIVSATSKMPSLSELQARIEHVDLPALNESEVAAYLMFRLTSVGYQGGFPFTDKDSKRFYQQSLGNPAALNHLAHQKLLGIRPKLTSPVKINFSKILRWTGLVLLSISLVLLLIFQDKVNALFKPEKQNIDEVIKLPELEQDELATVVVEDDPVLSSEQAERNELMALIEELPESDSVVNETVVELTTDETPIDESNIEVVEPAEKESKTGPEDELEIPEDKLEVEAKAEIELEEKLEKQDKPEMEESSVVIEQVEEHQQDWILQQRGTNYTFQLMGSWEHNDVSKFIEKYALTGDMAEFESLRNGRVWYALIYGVYDSKKAALDASNAWPAPLNTLPSWLRRFDSIQKQLTKKAQAQ